MANLPEEANLSIRIPRALNEELNTFLGHGSKRAVFLQLAIAVAKMMKTPNGREYLGRIVGGELSLEAGLFNLDANGHVDSSRAFPTDDAVPPTPASESEREQFRLRSSRLSAGPASLDLPAGSLPY